MIYVTFSQSNVSFIAPFLRDKIQNQINTLMTPEISKILPDNHGQNALNFDKWSSKRIHETDAN